MQGYNVSDNVDSTVDLMTAVTITGSVNILKVPLVLYACVVCLNGHLRHSSSITIGFLLLFVSCIFFFLFSVLSSISCFFFCFSLFVCRLVAMCSLTL